MLLTKLASWTLGGRQLFAALLIFISISSGLIIYAYTEGYSAAEDELKATMLLAQTKAIAEALSAQRGHYLKQLSIMKDKHKREIEIERQKNKVKNQLEKADIKCKKVEHENTVSYELNSDAVGLLNDALRTASDSYSRDSG